MHEASFASINWWSWQTERLPMGWFLLDFVVLLVLLTVAVRRPLKKVLSERHQSIKRAVAQAAESHAKASRAQADTRQRLTSLTAELRELERTSRADGEAERAHLVAQAEAYSARLHTEAEAQAGSVLRRMQERLRRRLLQEAIAEATAYIQGHLSEQGHSRLLDEAVAGLETTPATEVKP